MRLFAATCLAAVAAAGAEYQDEDLLNELMEGLEDIENDIDDLNSARRLGGDLEEEAEEVQEEEEEDLHEGEEREEETDESPSVLGCCSALGRARVMDWWWFPPSFLWNPLVKSLSR